MIRINVAPEIKYRSESTELVKIIVPMILFASLGYYATIFYGDMKNAEAEDIRAKIEEKKVQLAKLKLDVDKVRALQARLAELRSRADRIRSLSAGRKQPVLLLDTLQGQHLERMWFSNLRVENESVTLDGYAFDHAVIAEYVRRLKLQVGDNGAGSADLKDFVPPFMQPQKSLQADVQQSQSVAPIKMTRVNLIKSTAETQDNVLVQTFRVTFRANTK